MQTLLAFVVFTFLALGSPSAIADCGSNTPPIAVKTIGDLQNIQNNLSGSFILCNDIDASVTAQWNGGAGFIPIGSSALPFIGSFNGNGYTIRGLSMRSSAPLVGLFGTASSPAQISNLGLGNVAIQVQPPDQSGSSQVGALVGFANSAIISNVFSTGIIAVGSSQGVTSYVGGLVGGLFGTTIQQSYSIVTVSAGSNSFVGGLVGLSNGPLLQTFAAGPVLAGVNSYAGGLVGFEALPYGGVGLQQSFASGAVSSGAGSYIGGLSGGLSNASIIDSYATGSVAGFQSLAIGGLLGELYGGGAIARSYSVGAVSDSLPTNIGGLLGYSTYGSNNITYSYWDAITSKQSTSSGAVDCSDPVASPIYCGKSTNQLQASLPDTWTAPTWAIVPSVSYPVLGPLMDSPEFPIPSVRSTNKNFPPRSATFQSTLSMTGVPTNANPPAKTFAFIPAGQLQPWQYYNYTEAVSYVPSQSTAAVDVPDQACLGTVHAMIGRLVGLAHPTFGLQLLCANNGPSQSNELPLMCATNFYGAKSEALSSAHLEWFVNSVPGHVGEGIWPKPLLDYVNPGTAHCVDATTSPPCKVDTTRMTAAQSQAIVNAIESGQPLMIHGSDGGKDGHWMLATSVIFNGDGTPGWLVASDPWLGQQVMISIDPKAPDSDYQYAEVINYFNPVPDPAAYKTLSGGYCGFSCGFYFKFDIEYFAIKLK